MTLQVSIIVGNPKRNSRTLRVATTLASQLFDPLKNNTAVIDLADHKDSLFAWPSEAMDRLNRQVANSDVAIFASPTYKATYTGLLKAFLDRYPANGLAGVIALPVHTGADLAHSMGPTVNLAPLLVELGAIVPGRGFYFVVEHMDRLDAVVHAAAAEYADNLRRIARIGESLAPPSAFNGARRES